MNKEFLHSSLLLILFVGVASWLYTFTSNIWLEILITSWIFWAFVITVVKLYLKDSQRYKLLFKIYFILQTALSFGASCSLSSDYSIAYSFTMINVLLTYRNLFYKEDWVNIFFTQLVPVYSLALIFSILGISANFLSFDVTAAEFRWFLVPIASLVYLINSRIEYTSKRIDLEEKQAKAESLDWFKTMINLVSHNLRTPLSTILSNVELIKLKASNYEMLQLDDEYSRIFTAVRDSENSLNRLLRASYLAQDDRVSQSFGGSLKASYPDIFINEMQDISLNYQDRVSIRLALEVFIDNAIKYGADPVIVTIDNERISVEDSGPGLSEQNFTNFGHANVQSGASLHGIGIPFAIRILESANWSVKAEDNGPGLKVILTKTD